MSHSPSALPPAPKTLDEQKADFTAEGAPPPGKAGTPIPAIDLPVGLQKAERPVPKPPKSK